MSPQRLVHRLHGLWLDRLCRPLLTAPPLRPREPPSATGGNVLSGTGAAGRAMPDPVTIVSMVRHRDLLMYLLAIRSLLRWLPVAEIVVLDDGSLSARDRGVLHRQLGAPAIRPITDIATGDCPRGGCWERLLHILDLSRDRYVIQLDSDVLAVRPIPEVQAAIAANTAFTLASEARYGIVDIAEAARQVADRDPRETQFLAEQLLPQLPASLGRRYVRGSAGFAGFARGGPGRAAAEAFSAAMRASMGARWMEWGTEQVASNYLVANSPGAQLLPWARYCCFFGDPPSGEVALLHFIGTWRFQRGVYARLARRTVQELLAPAPPVAR